MNTDWIAEARCAGSELDFFEFAKDGIGFDGVDEAKLRRLAKVCCRCPVQRECAEYAMRDGGAEQYGVWAGATPRQRRDARRSHDPIAAVLELAKANRDKAVQTSLLRTGTDGI